VSETVPAGGTASTDTENDGATAQDQVETSVTSPNGGTVTITESPSSGPPPSGFQLLGQDINISAPPATPGNPLVLKFRLDGTLIAGLDINSITVFKNGVAVPDCTGAPGTASPDPCVASRQMIGDDLEITVLSSTASLWQLGVAVATPSPSPSPTPGGETCDGRAATIVGTDGKDFIIGTDGADVIVSLGGKDIVFGLKGDDVICLGAGNDIAFGGKGNDSIFGEGGKDKLFGEKGDDFLDGGPDRDHCFGGRGSDTTVNCERGDRHHDDDDDDDRHHGDDDHDDDHDDDDDKDENEDHHRR
jgi:Ca2+-binding RTX toxin-like protein